MKIIVMVVILYLYLYAEQCQSLYAKSKHEWIKTEAVIKSDIPSHKAYAILNDYLSLGSETIAECAIVKAPHGFRIIRELTAQMKRVSQVREQFKVQTFNELKEEAKIEAKKEVQCTTIYNNTYIRRPKDEAHILPHPVP